MTTTTTDLGIERDTYGRYKITPAGTKRAKSYSRVTTIAKAIEDTHNITMWKLRNALKGVADRKDLLLQIQTLDPEKDKRTLDRIAETCLELGGGTKAATTGTAIHSILEKHDRGAYTLGEKPPAELVETIQTYAEVLKANEVTVLPEWIETVLVNDEDQYAGTVDRIVQIGGVHYIADLKTGKTLDFGGLGFGSQLAAYAHCTHATSDGKDRRELPPVNQQRALIIHAPSNALHHVSLHWIDIENGWAAFQLAMQVRAMRNLGKHFVLSELTPAGPPIDDLPISADDFQNLKGLLNALGPEQLAMVRAGWPEHIPTPKAHAQGQPILRGHAQEIHQLIQKQQQRKAS